MPKYIASKAVEHLNRIEVDCEKAQVLVIGVAYKRDVSDLRESPALEIIRFLKDEGIHIDYHDPFVPKLELNDIKCESVPLMEATLPRYDCILITTDHTVIDYGILALHKDRVLDTRNCL